MSSRNRNLIFIPIFLFFAVIFGVERDRIIFTDEIIYEDIAYTMYKTGDYLTPKLRGEVWLEKPPLYPFLTALFYNLIEPTPLARRLVTVIASLVTLGLVYKLAKQFYSDEVSIIASAILACIPLFLYFTKTANLDILATAFITASFLFYVKARDKPKFLLLSGISLGFGILTRSFMAFTPITAIMIDQLFFSKKKLSMKIAFLSLGLALLVVLPWHVYILQEHPEEFKEIFIQRNLDNFFQGQVEERRPSSTAKFLFDSLVRYNPLSFLLLAVVFSKKNRKKVDPIFYVWIANTFIPLTIAVNHSPWYTMQALPPLAILMSLGLETVYSGVKKRFSYPTYEMFCLVLLIALTSLVVGVFSSLKTEPRTVSSLRLFIDQTPDDTPLYNFEHQFTPQSCLFNPRETPIIEYDDLERIKKPIHVYIDGPMQLSKFEKAAKSCCTYEEIIKDQGASIFVVNP